MKRTSYQSLQHGFGLIELLVATSVISVSLFALVAVIQASFQVTSVSGVKARAEFLAEEGVEVVKILRDNSWSSNIATLATSTPYYPVFATSTGVWSLATVSPALIDNTYTREVIIDDVYRRDSDSDIVASTSPDSKSLDAGTREVTSRVLWGSDSLQFGAYITDLFSN